MIRHRPELGDNSCNLITETESERESEKISIRHGCVLILRFINIVFAFHKQAARIIATLQHIFSINMKKRDIRVRFNHNRLSKDRQQSYQTTSGPMWARDIETRHQRKFRAVTANERTKPVKQTSYSALLTKCPRVFKFMKGKHFGCTFQSAHLPITASKFNILF